MASTLAEMTPEEFRRLLEATVEQKLREVLGLEAEAEGGPLRDELRERLQQQREAVAVGERGLSMDDVTAALDLG